ncbi:MAG: RHS repeat-associated core domain-containing protein [Pseudomonadota bacterium]
MPIAAVINGSLFAIHSDNLNTPRRLSNTSTLAVWQWKYSAFGDEAPTIAANRFADLNVNPNSGTATVASVSFNLRYPGQYADAESGLSYNYFRSYDSGSGRYTQADPVGLDGGWNRFGYVYGNPLKFADPLGLQKTADEMLGPDSKDQAISPDYPVTPRRPSPPPMPPPPPTPPEGGEPWPGADDWRGQCIRLYTQCQNQNWGGDCGACLNKCTAQQEWPFSGPGACRPRRNQNMCSAF